MGNFGKRLLIITLAVVLVVALAVGGNAYQNRNKNHVVSSGKQVVYSGNVYGTSYEVTKNDVWKNILYSSPMTTIDEIVDKYLLSSYIDNQTSEKVAEKINYLIYSTTDADKIAEYQADTENDAKLKQSFYNRLAVLGYTQNGDAGHTINDYAKLMLAYDDYATYRLNEGLKIGSLEPKLDDETLTEELEKKVKDTLAITIRFNSVDEAKDFYKTYELAEVSSKLRKYIGNTTYVVDKNDDGDYYLDDNLNPVLKTMEVVDDNGDTITVNIPKGNLTSTDDVYTWDLTRPAWYLDGDTTPYHFLLSGDTADENGSYAACTTAFTASTATEFDDVTTFSTSNTAVLSVNNFLCLYVLIYNNYYSQLREAFKTSITLDDFFSAFGFTATNGLISDENAATLNSALKKYNLVLVKYNNGTSDVQEIRKYVGNDEYVVELDDNGAAKSEYGFAVYKQYDSKNIPNYKILVDENGDPVLDYKDNFQYELDEDGEKIANDSKLSINDQTTFDLTNTITPNLISLYAAYYNAYFDYAYEGYSDEYKAHAEAIGEYLLYNQEDLSASRSDVSTQIFTTLTFDVSSTGGYLAKPTSMTAANSSETPYYMILKLGSSTIENPTDEEIAEFKSEKIDTYLKVSGLPQMAAAELRSEAGLRIYDEFFVYEYNSIISNDSDSNSYGTSEVENYYKDKGYSNKKLVSLNNKVTVNGNELDKFTVTSDDLYNYAMESSASSYLSTTILNKVLVTMSDFEKIHGTNKNYLTSKNWKMEEYAQITQYYNYNYEYYKTVYAQYGYDYYDSLEEFLYAYGARSFDDMVEAFERGTMRNVLLYNILVGDLFDNTDSYVLNLSDYALNGTYNNELLLFNSDKFKELYEDYFDANVYHLLFYVDHDENGSPDDYEKFLETFDATTGNSSFLKDSSGNALSFEAYLELVRKLENLLRDYLNENDFSGTNLTPLSSFITEYNNSSILDGDYKEFKKVGIKLQYESLGEVTSSNVSNYVEPFGDGVRIVYEKLERIDNKLLGYSVADSLTLTEFGLHLIVETAGTNFDKPSFKYSDESSSYASGVSNDNDEISESQIAIYILQNVYTNIFGDTDNPEENAGFNYPNIPSSVLEAINTYYSSFFTKVLDSSNTYHSNYLILTQLVKDNSEYQSKFQELLDIYYSVLFGILA